jgi:hypothetical protein
MKELYEYKNIVCKGKLTFLSGEIIHLVGSQNDVRDEDAQIRRSRERKALLIIPRPGNIFLILLQYIDNMLAIELIIYA